MKARKREESLYAVNMLWKRTPPVCCALLGDTTDVTSEKTGNVPVSGVLAGGVPADGVPEGGVPADGVPTSGVPAAGVPACCVAAGTVTVTNSVLVTVTKPLPDCGRAVGEAPACLVCVLVLVLVETGTAADGLGAPAVAEGVLSPPRREEKMGPTSPLIGSVARAIREFQSFTATVIASCWPMANLVFATAATAALSSV